MKQRLVILALVCGLFALMGANCNVNVVPAGTYSPSIGVLPAGGLFGQGLSYPSPNDSSTSFGPGIPPVGSKMGFWTIY